MDDLLSNDNNDKHKKNQKKEQPKQAQSEVSKKEFCFLKQKEKKQQDCSFAKENEIEIQTHPAASHAAAPCVPRTMAPTSKPIAPSAKKPISSWPQRE